MKCFHDEQIKICGPSWSPTGIKGAAHQMLPWKAPYDLWDLQMGHLGPTWVLLGFLVAQKMPDTRPKCVLTIIPAKSDQLATVGTKAGPSSALRSFSPS